MTLQQFKCLGDKLVDTYRWKQSLLFVYFGTRLDCIGGRKVSSAAVRHHWSLFSAWAAPLPVFAFLLFTCALMITKADIVVVARHKAWKQRFDPCAPSRSSMTP